MIANVLFLCMLSVAAAHHTDFVHSGTVQGDKLYTYHLVLPQQNVEDFLQLALDIADPVSSIYGKHMTRDQVLEMIAPPYATRKEILDFMIGSGVVACSDLGDAIKCVDSVKNINNMFNTSMSYYTQTNGPTFVQVWIMLFQTF